MDKIKTVTNKKLNTGDKNVLLYIVACVAIALQPLLDLLSSAVINAGKSSFISVSGAVRAIFMVAILICSLFFYKGKYKKLFCAYLSGASIYIFIVCLMTVIRGTAIASAYMIGLMADTFFFHFAFVALVELYYTVGRRVSPFITTGITLIYALTIVINYLFKKTNTFNFSSSFAVTLALLIPIALVVIASHIGKVKTSDKTKSILSYIIPIFCAVIILVAAVLSNSRPVLFISVIFSVIFFMWAFSGWRNSKDVKRKKPLAKGFVSSALFCVLILAFLPISPVKSSFDGTFKLSELFYTYSGPVQSGIPNSNQEEETLPFEDEDDLGNDYIPILNSGYDPNDHRDDDEEEKEEKTSSKKPSADKPNTTESTTTDASSTSEPAGDESTSEEISDTTLEETTNRWQLPTFDMSDIDNFFSTLPMPSLPWETTTTTTTEPTTEEEGTQPPSTEYSSDEEVVDSTNEIPVAAIGVGALSMPGLLPPNTLAINLDRVKYFADSFFASNMETWLFGLRFSSLFDEDLSPALKVKSDPFSVFLNYGVFGLLVYLLPIVFIFIKLLKFILFNFSRVFESIGLMTYLFSAFAILILSVFDGDVLAFSAVGSIAALILANAFTLCEEKTANIK